MNSYVVSLRQKGEDGEVSTLLLDQETLAHLLLNIDDEKFQLGEIVSTYSSKKDSILPFCKVNKNLETGTN